LLLAEALAAVVDDAALRAGFVAEGRRRLAGFRSGAMEAAVLGHLAGVA
jgi:hypothetical protein